jgi:hypothetical protein
MKLELVLGNGFGMYCDKDFTDGKIIQRDADQLILDAELAKKDVEMDSYAKMNQSLVRDCCNLTDEVANAESVAWDLQKQIEKLKQFDIRQWIPDGKYCEECKFKTGGKDYDHAYCVIGEEIERDIDWVRQCSGEFEKCESCPKPDKGEVK